jgi:prepilin-type processing-associated H-X9-DG protein
LSKPGLQWPTGSAPNPGGGGPGSGTTPAYPALSYRSPFICPSTPAADVSPLAAQTQDGYWQNVSCFWDKNLQTITTSNPVTQTNAFVLQSSYGINGSNTSTGGNAGNTQVQVPCIFFNPPAPGATPNTTNQKLRLRSMKEIRRPADMAFMYDGLIINWYTNIGFRIRGRHGSQSGTDPTQIGRTNIAYFDGHSENVARKELPNSAAEFDNTSPAVLTQQHPKVLWRVDQN